MGIGGVTAAEVERPRVSTRIADGLAAGPVVIVAPAGYGKTAALRQALDGWTGPVVWHACGPRDGDAGLLAVAVLRALRRVLPGAADVLLDLLAQPGTAVSPAEVVEALLAELSRLVVDSVVVVLDDAEQLSDDAASVESLAALLDADPAVLRLVLVSRRRLPLRLARRAAAGTLTLVDEADLRFDADETAALLLRLDGRTPRDEDVAAALDETRGWPLGLRLRLGGGGERALEQYLAEEVLGQLGPPHRAALLDLSVDPTFAVDDPDAAPDGAGGSVTAGVASPALLDAVARLGLTPEPSTSEPGRLAWHPLVREALRARWLTERPPAARARLQARSAQALVDHGRHAEAVDRWLDAGRSCEAVVAMVAAAPEVLRAAPATMRRWLDRVDADNIDDADANTAEVAWLRGRLAAAEGRVREAAGHYVQALPDLDPERADGALLGIVEATYFLGDLSMADPVAAILRSPEALAGRPVALLASAWLGMVQAGQGDLDAGSELAERAFSTEGGELARQFAPLLVLFQRAPGGHHDEIRETILAIESTTPAIEFPEWLASIRGFMEADVGRVDAAVEQAARMVSSAGRDDGTRYWRSLGAIQHAWALAEAGRFDEAEVALAPWADAHVEGWPTSWIHAGNALVAMHAGRVDEARDRAERTLAHSQGAPLFAMTIAICDVLRVLAAVGATSRALEVANAVVERLEGRLGPERGAHALGRVRALRSVLLAELGRPDAAAADLQAALDGGADVVRAQWREIESPLWSMLATGELDPGPVARLVEVAFRGGPELLGLASHPSPTVRAAVAPAVARSSHPSAAARLKALAGDADPAVAEAAERAAAQQDQAPSTSLALQLFGTFEARRGGWLIDDKAWGRPTAARLVRFLLVRGGEPTPQDLILEALWPDRPADSAKGQLQVAVSRARAVLDAPGSDAAGSAIRFADRAYRLVLPPSDRVDTQRFAHTAAAALATEGPGRRAALAGAAALWGGTPLPEERYASWSTDWREALEGTHHRVLTALAAEQLAGGDAAAVIDTAQRLVAHDPLDEAAHRLLIRAYARSGRPALALRQFLACRRALVEELGLEPSGETRGLQQAVLDGSSI